MKLKFWKKEVVKEPEKKLYSILNIRLKGGWTIGVNRLIDKRVIILPWIGFWRWYFIRKSPRYNLLYRKGCYLIERENIDFVHIYTEMR